MSRIVRERYNPKEVPSGIWDFFPDWDLFSGPGKYVFRMTYSSAIQFLYDLRLFGTKMGLENTFRLAALMGNPQETLRFIHVAGTNGKGSTCAMMDSIYRAAGFKTGLYTSPHLVSFRERIQVAGEKISENDVVRLVERMQSILAEFSKETYPTFFEVVTVMAMQYFAERQCEVVIWETGLGGRLDATNIVTPMASVITNIDLDHEKWLGATLAEIAGEKAGIIKPGVPVLTAEKKTEPLSVIRKRAEEAGSALVVVADDAANCRPETAALAATALPGEHQRSNAALAVATVRLISNRLHVANEAIKRGLEEVRWPGRFQIIHYDSGRTVILDGAHNPAGADVLKLALRTYFPGQRPVLVMGVMQDKDWAGICNLLVPSAREVWFVPVTSDRTADPEAMREYAKRISPGIQAHATERLNDALDATSGDEFVVVTGSLHLIGEATELLGLSSSPARSERELNEWKAVP